MTVKDILQKSVWSEIDFMNFVLEASASSARFGVIEEKEDNKYYVTRANIHAMLILPFGAGKTSSLVEIPNAFYCYDVSFPGLIGTINKDGEVVESAIMKAGGKVLVIDEFQLLSREVKNALNSILEYPHIYSRTLGYKIRSSVSRRGKYFYIKAKQNTNKFEVYSKFSCIASGMFVSKRTPVDKAFFSRFIPIRFTPSIDYYEKMSKGEKMLKINPINIECSFVFDDYLKFHSYFWNKVKNSVSGKYFMERVDETGWLVRCLQDLVRLSAFVESLDGRNTVSYDTAKYVCDKMFNFMLMSYKTSILDEKDIFILMNLSNMKQVEIARYLEVSEAYVSQRIDFLKKMGLIL